jgi:hypothetical protein
LREDRRALHEQHDIVLADLALDALLYRIRHSSISFQERSA